MNLIEVKTLKLKEENRLIPYNVVLCSSFNLHYVIAVVSVLSASPMFLELHMWHTFSLYQKPEFK